MDCYDFKMTMITVLLWVSVAFLVAPVIGLLVSKLKNKHTNGLLLTSGCLLASVWCLRYAVGYYGIITTDSEQAVLTGWEEISNSLIHALQTFSMDEDYTAYILDGKAMLRDMFGKDTTWQTVYGGYAAAMNIIAIMAGGAIIFEILASIFPKIKLFFACLLPKREKLYFSKLDETTFALAESLYKSHSKRLNKPVIVFAGINPEDGSGGLMNAIKGIGGICLKEDLTHVRKHKRGIVRFFLMDENETSNLQNMTGLVDSYLADPYLRKALKRTEICYFTTGDAYIQVEKNLQDRLSKDYGFQQKDMPVLIPIRSYRNLVSNLLTEVPLYAPLVGKQKNPDGTQDLTVTLLGSGFIGTQMFLATYWFGQILNCNLKIRVISQETEETFWSKIDYVNPEIRRTTNENDSILQINRKGDMAPVYAQVEYTQCDARSSAFISKLTDPADSILKTDYFFVALGTDDENISVANTVRKYIGQHRVATTKRVKAVIAYVVYDTELAETLNIQMRHSFTEKTMEDKPVEADVYMRAVGSLSELYSAKNVFMTQFELLAQKANANYNSAQNRKVVAEVHHKRIKDDYKHWASLARSMHVMYKLYSMGLVDYSVFDKDYTPESYAEKQENAYKAYEALVCKRYPHPNGDVDENGKPIMVKGIVPLHEMAWLEHRRWNAFTRVMGFRHPNTCQVYAPNLGYKHMDLKLHPCLVECDKNGMRAEINEMGIFDESTTLKSTDCDNFDLLDDLSYDMYAKGWNGFDFKLYDYPADDV